MTVELLSDEQITRLSPEERHHLVARIREAGLDGNARPDVPPDEECRIRRPRLGMLAASTIGLALWTAFIGVSLPTKYTAHNWRLTWVGFDLMMITMLAGTIVLALLRRHQVMMTAFATGVLLVCDAWFDVMTASAGDRAESIGLAVLVELPFAALLIVGTVKLGRIAARNPRLFMR